MIGTVKRLTDSDSGFISARLLEMDLFFHSNSLVGLTFDELREGDSVIFDTELIPRRRASRDTLQHGELLLPYGEQKIIPRKSVEEVELQNKITAEFITRLNQNPTDLYQLTAKDFEELIAELYRIDGYTAELLSPWNKADGGVDIVVMKSDIGSAQFRMAIQCKRHARTNRVSAPPIRSLAGVLDRFHAHAGAFVTTSDFTKPARIEATFFWKITLMNFESIVEMLRRAELLVSPAITFSPEVVKTPDIPEPDIPEPDIPEMFMNAVNIQRN
ncbi:MAG TPA: restriction endonuclease [Thermoanaerobaculia bacterium]|jgi:cold shock CspA family protein|nr:restriction endonuclease [Thermoanaerobaculia bacterium]